MDPDSENFHSILDNIIGEGSVNSEKFGVLYESLDHTDNAEVLKQFDEIHEDIVKEKESLKAVIKPPKSKAPLSPSFSKTSESQKFLPKSYNKSLKAATQLEVRTKLPSNKTSSVSLTSKPRKLGALPSYLKKSKDANDSQRDSELLKKKFESEKSKLFQHQVDFMKIYNDCKKACDKASQVFDQNFKLVAADESSQEGNNTETLGGDFGIVENEYKVIVQDLLNECKSKIKENFPGDSNCDVISNIENFLLDEFQEKLREILKPVHQKVPAQVSVSSEQSKSEENEEFKKLQTEVQNLSKKLKQSEGTYRDQLKRINDQTKEINSFRKKTESLEAEKLEKDSLIKEKSEQIKILEQRIRKLLKNNTNLDLEAEVKSLRVHNEIISNEKFQIDEMLTEVSKENEDFLLKINELTKQISEAKKEKPATTETSFAIDPSTENQESINETLKIAQEKILKAKAELENEKANSRVQNNLLDLRAELINKMLETDLSYRGTIKKLNDQIAEYEKESDRKQLQRKASQEEIRNLLNTLSSKQLEIDRLEQKIQYFDDMKSTHEVTISKLHNQLKKLQENPKNSK